MNLVIHLVYVYVGKNAFLSKYLFLITIQEWLKKKGFNIITYVLYWPKDHKNGQILLRCLCKSYVICKITKYALDKGIMALTFGISTSFIIQL